jgi:hypothetical protein
LNERLSALADEVSQGGKRSKKGGGTN